MALIACPECNNQISDQLNTVCPSCGHVHDDNALAFEKAKKRTQKGWTVYILFASVVAFVLGFLIAALADSLIALVLTQVVISLYFFFKFNIFLNKFNKGLVIFLGFALVLIYVFQQIIR